MTVALKVTPLAEITLEQAAETFMRLELAGASPATRQWYASILGEFCASFPSSRLGDLMEGDLRAWAAGLYTSKRSVWTVHAHIRAVKRLTKWLAGGLLGVDIGQGLKLPRLPKTTRRGVSDRDAERMLEAARENPRDYALLLFLASTGCRRAGAANLRASDLNLDAADGKLQRQAVVHEKGDKERTVLMTPEALEAVRAWVQISYCESGERVFGLTPGGVSALVRRYSNRLGIRDASPHQWRHRLARRLLQEGVELALVSQLMGHARVDVTVSFYGQLQVGQLQEAYDRAWGRRKG